MALRTCWPLRGSPLIQIQTLSTSLITETIAFCASTTAHPSTPAHQSLLHLVFRHGNQPLYYPDWIIPSFSSPTSSIAPSIFFIWGLLTTPPLFPFNSSSTLPYYWSGNNSTLDLVLVIPFFSSSFHYDQVFSHLPWWEWGIRLRGRDLHKIHTLLVN